MLMMAFPFSKELVILLSCSLILAEVSIHPVIFLAGYMGTQLKYKLYKMNNAPFFCQRNLYTPRSLWLDAYQAFSPTRKVCWLHFMSLEYDQKTRKTKSPSGVQVIVPSMGDTAAIEYITPFPFHAKPAEYYINIIESLEKIGYSRGKTIFGAPYDWRKAPNEQEEIFHKLKSLVQDAYLKNGGKQVILFGHSMGGNFAYIFLRKQSLTWKKRFIRAIIFAGSPWGGNFKHMYDYLYQDDFPADLLPEFRVVERTFPSLAFLLPHERTWDNDVFIHTPSNEYTALNMDKFFEKIGNLKALDMWKDTRDLMDPFLHPEVDIYCVPGVGFNTPRSVTFFSDKDFFVPRNNIKRHTNFSEGDGFVNIESAVGCLKWFSHPEYRFYFKLLNTSHLGMLRNPDDVKFFTNLIHTLPQALD